MVQDKVQAIIFKVLEKEKIKKSLFELTHPQEESFGDYATNIAMKLSKSFKKSPLEIGTDLVSKILKEDKGRVFERVEVVGPGFINFRIKNEVFLEEVREILEKKGAYGKKTEKERKTVVIDYFQPNVAKPLHVGHLRSGVIGDALARLLRFLDFKVISDTHLGDWGTQFGILICAYRQWGDDKVIKKDPIRELNKLYVKYNQEMVKKPEMREAGKAEFKKLEEGNKENRELWEWFVEVTMKELHRIIEKLEIGPFDYHLGESFYEERMRLDLLELGKKKLLIIGEDGEKYVDLEKFGLGRAIMVKADGATTYMLRDVATFRYRRDNFKPYKNLYVVDYRQAHHFRQLLKVFELLGWEKEGEKISKHVIFGEMKSTEGGFSTRKGNIIELQKVLSEGEKKALEVIKKKNPNLENKAVVSQKVALAALKYFDLSHDRETNIVFSWDKVLDFEGNTGPYLQYTHARIWGILRKLDVKTDFEFLKDLRKEEIELLKTLYKFPEICVMVEKNLKPHFLANFLFDLASHFNTFYANVRVISEEDQQKKDFRLYLLKATAQVLKNGLKLLGIEPLERM
jgi:arginyl-tRNA synthetase